MGACAAHQRVESALQRGDDHLAVVVGVGQPFQVADRGVDLGAHAAWRKLAVGRAPGGAEGAVTKLFAVIVFNTALSAGDVTALQAILAPASL
mgnify:CR=1 FL=1